MRLKNTVMMIGLAFMSSCAGSEAWHSIKMSETASQANSNNQKIMNVNIGQSKEEVVKIMGQPERREMYQIPENRTIEFIFYRTLGWSANDAGDSSKHFTPFAFEKGILLGWGQNYYDNVVKESIELTINHH